MREIVAVWRRAAGGGILLAVLFAGQAAQAQYYPWPYATPDANGITNPSVATSLPYNGDPWGVRKRLADHGVTYNFVWTNDLLSNVQGGNKRGTIGQG